MFKQLISERVNWKAADVKRNPDGNYMVIIKVTGVPIYHTSYSPAEAFELLADSVEALQNTAVLCQKEFENKRIKIYPHQGGFVYSIYTKNKEYYKYANLNDWYESELVYMTEKETVIECVRRMMMFIIPETEYCD